jgi:uncharacterized repeat protein (TIGR03803 family)
MTETFMKTCIKNLFLLPALMTGLGLIQPVTAQIFTTLHTFTAISGSNYTNSDGAQPYAGLILSGNTLYGAANAGGTNGSGTVFAINTNGAGYTVLYTFTAINYNGSFDTNSDGYSPETGLIISGNTLYGTTFAGGTNGSGTVFAINTNGTGFTVLYTFTALSGSRYTNSDGAYPYGTLILSGNTLYGEASEGGTNNGGTVFAINTNGTRFTNLYTFTFGNDGGDPVGGLTLSGNSLYGTTYGGGSFGHGTVFAVNINGTGFTTLHNFTTVSGSPYTNSDGANPDCTLILSGNTLYGTTTAGGTHGFGTVFALNINNTNLTTLHTFAGGSDGRSPYAGLILSGNTLYGTAAGAQIFPPPEGGTNGSGTMFAINTDGTGFTNLYNFTLTRTNSSGAFTNSDGVLPTAGLILSGSTLYGTAQYGGSSDNGTVFGLNLVPSLGITAAGNQVLLSWPTWAPNFNLLTATNLAEPIVWATASPAPVVVNAQNIVTNPISETQQFFRLSQ